jgi:hypothetical protein
MKAVGTGGGSSIVRVRHLAKTQPTRVIAAVTCLTRIRDPTGFEPKYSNWDMAIPRFIIHNPTAVSDNTVTYIRGVTIRRGYD